MVTFVMLAEVVVHILESIPVGSNMVDAEAAAAEVVVVVS